MTAVDQRRRSEDQRLQQLVGAVAVQIGGRRRVRSLGEEVLGRPVCPEHALQAHGPPAHPRAARMRRAVGVEGLHEERRAEAEELLEPERELLALDDDLHLAVAVEIGERRRRDELAVAHVDGARGDRPGRQLRVDGPARDGPPVGGEGVQPAVPRALQHVEPRAAGQRRQHGGRERPPARQPRVRRVGRGHAQARGGRADLPRPPRPQAAAMVEDVHAPGQRGGDDLRPAVTVEVADRRGHADGVPGHGHGARAPGRRAPQTEAQDPGARRPAGELPAAPVHDVHGAAAVGEDEVLAAVAVDVRRDRRHPVAEPEEAREAAAPGGVVHDGDRPAVLAQQPAVVGGAHAQRDRVLLGRAQVVAVLERALPQRARHLCEIQRGQAPGQPPAGHAAAAQRAEVGLGRLGSRRPLRRPGEARGTARADLGPYRDGRPARRIDDGVPGRREDVRHGRDPARQHGVERACDVGPSVAVVEAEVGARPARVVVPRQLLDRRGRRPQHLLDLAGVQRGGDPARAGGLAAVRRHERGHAALRGGRLGRRPAHGRHREQAVRAEARVVRAVPEAAW